MSSDPERRSSETNGARPKSISSKITEEERRCQKPHGAAEKVTFEVPSENHSEKSESDSSSVTGENLTRETSFCETPNSILELKVPQLLNREVPKGIIKDTLSNSNINGSSNLLWSRSQKDANELDHENKNVQIVSLKRRRSTHIDLPEGRRKDSMKTIFFGDPNYRRRFSQDLRLPEGPEDEDEIQNETAKVIFFQVFIPFLIAGFGNVGAGLILDYVQHWTVFKTVTELFILVASFLGFKGNLEMTLASRLSTQANCGKIDDRMEQLKVGFGNIALVQCQAIVVAFLAALIAIGADFFKEMSFHTQNALFICATSLITASVTGLFLATIMVVVIIVSRRLGVNPDNVSTLIAAFLGDITAVAFLAGIAKILFENKHIVWLSPLIIAFFLALLPVFLFIAFRNEYTKKVVNAGWGPIILAMVISSVGGFIFDYAVGMFESIAIFQPIINGVGSNLVAVQASRISTFYHQRCSLGELPTEDDGSKARVCQSPVSAYIGSNPNVRTARLLLLMALPGHIMYVVTIRLIKKDVVVITGPFISVYLSVSAFQVALLLYIAYVLVPFLWKRKVDPDDAAIPGLMALGDLLGTAFLTSAFLFLSSIDDPNAILR